MFSFAFPTAFHAASIAVTLKSRSLADVQRLVEVHRPGARVLPSLLEVALSEREHRQHHAQRGGHVDVRVRDHVRWFRLHFRFRFKD